MPSRNNVFGNTSLIVSLLLFSTGMTYAQGFGGPQPERQAVGVLERDRPAYDAKGIPLGGFRLYPRLNFDTAFDDNVFRLPAAQSDWYFRETPTLRLRSQWGQHFMEVYGGADNYNYARFSSLDLTDWNLGAAGRYDIARGISVAGTNTYGEYHEALYSPNTVGNQISPTRFHKNHSEITASYHPASLGIGAGFSVDRLTYASVPLLGGGLVSNKDRNQKEYQAYVRAFYDFSPGYTAFVKAAYDSRVYDQFFSRSGFHRSSNGFRLDGGVELQLTNLIEGEIFVGYLEQHYAQNVPTPLQNISGLDYGAQLNWYPTQLMTVHLTASHTVSDSIISGVSASEDDTGKLSAEYELGYNLIAQAYGGYTHSRLQGSSRSDDYPSAGINLKYLMNEYLSANLSYDYDERSSTVPSANYRDNMISFRITGHI
jgi:hypothetical protein